MIVRAMSHSKARVWSPMSCVCVCLLQVQSVIPWLSDVVEMMEKASKVCQDIIEKVA